MNKRFSTLLGTALCMVSVGVSAQSQPTGTTSDQLTYPEIANDGKYYVMTSGSGTDVMMWTRDNAAGKDSLIVNGTLDFSTATFAEIDSALWKLVRLPGAGEIFEIENKATKQKLAFSSDWKNRTTAIVSASSTGAISQFSVANNNIPYATFGANADSIIYLSTTAGELAVTEVATSGTQTYPNALNLNYFRKPVSRALTAKDLNNKLGEGRGFQLFFSYDGELTTDNNALAGVIFEAARNVQGAVANDNATEVLLRAKTLASKKSGLGYDKPLFAYIDTICYDASNKTRDGSGLTFKVDTIPTTTGGWNMNRSPLSQDAFTFSFYVDPSSATDSVAVYVKESYNMQTPNHPRTYTATTSSANPYPLQIAPLAGTSKDRRVLTTDASTAVTTALGAETRISFTGGTPVAPIFDATKVYSVKNVNEAADDENSGKYLVLAPVSATAYGESYADAVYSHLPSTQFVFDGSQMINRENATLVKTGALYAVEDVEDTYTNLTDTFEIKAMEDVNLQDTTIGWAYISEDSLINYAFSLDYLSGILSGRSINMNADSVISAMETEGMLFKLEGSGLLPVADGADIDEVKPIYNQTYTISSKDKKYIIAEKDNKLVLTSTTSGATAAKFYLRDTETKGEYILINEDGEAKYNVNSTDETLEAVALNLTNNAFAVQVEPAPAYVLDAHGHYNIATARGDMLAADAEGFGMLRREGDLKADYVADDFALWVDTADIHPTEPSYFILSGATVGENGELAGNFLRVMSDSADVEGYKADNEMTRLAFVPAKREAGATSDSLLVNYQNETLTKADSVGYKGKNVQDADKIDVVKQFQFKFQYTDVDGEYLVESAMNDAHNYYLASYNEVLCLTEAGKDQALVVRLESTEAPTANDEISTSEVKVIAGAGQITISGAAGKQVVVSNILGQVVANTVLTSDNATIAAPQGVVVVAVEGEEAVKAIVK